MSDDLAAEHLSTLRNKLRKDDRSIAQRKVAEATPLGYNERRKLYKSERTEQTNLKFTPTFKKRLQALADAASQTLTEYIEQAVEERAERGW